MPLLTCKAILGMGVFFLLLGIAFILWNKREKKAYYNSMLTRRDVKEFITREPERPWLNAFQIGGRISVILGILLALAGGILWLVLY